MVYEKGSDRLWSMTGRLDDNQGPCRRGGLAVELDNDRALLHVPDTHEVTTWRRNGSAFDWIPTGRLDIATEPAVSNKPVTLQGLTAVTPATPFVFRRSGDTWTRHGTVTPVDFPNIVGTVRDVIYRDGVLLTIESSRGFGPPSRPYVYLETSPGEFDHVGVIDTSGTVEQDLSGRTVVTAVDFGGPRAVSVTELPSPVRAEDPIVNDFEDGDLSDFTFNGGAFALASGTGGTVLRRTDTPGLGVAVLDGSDWSDQQRVSAQIAPQFDSPDGSVGLVVRYVDPDNYYYLAIRNDQTYRLYRRLSGMDTILLAEFHAAPLPSRVTLVADGQYLSWYFDDAWRGTFNDSVLRRGRAGLATFQTRADFDDVHVAATTEPVTLMERDFPRWGNDYARPFEEIGGRWQVVHDTQTGTNIGIAQLDASGDALAVSGVPVRNQEITANVRLDSFGPSRQGAWFGLLARYVDRGTHYYVTVRSTNLIQIRKQVNGVITVLDSASFAAVPGRDYGLRFRVIDDQLQLFVDDVLVASARDDDIASGRYGIGMYRSTALWRTVRALQP